VENYQAAGKSDSSGNGRKGKEQSAEGSTDQKRGCRNETGEREILITWI